MKKIYRTLKDKSGEIMVIVLAFVSLMIMSVLYLGNMMKQDVNLVQRVVLIEQASYVARAGINHAFARLQKDGFDAREDFQGTLDTGTYTVTYSETAGRYTLTSLGATRGVTRTIIVEVVPLTPTALNFASGAGNNYSLFASLAVAVIRGGIHANNDVYLSARRFFSSLTVTGSVSAKGIVKLGAKYKESDDFDQNVVINGISGESATYEEGARGITFPSFNYERYREEAQESGDYYDTSQVFDSVTLSPGNGIVFVDGDATFTGNCDLYGGIVADNIRVEGDLSQYKSGERNIIVARAGDVGVLDRLYTQEALIFASRDIIALSGFADFNVNGVMLARRNIDMWSFLTYVTYDYINTYPSDMEEEPEGKQFEIISWDY
ncbi:MAG: hypothetical protein WBD04_06810 [Candidatus Omnitrophota bacterium]